MRPTRERLMMGFAHLVRDRSTCSRLQVGAVITSSNFRKVLGYGYNGNAAGLPHCSDPRSVEWMPGQCPCVHAEANAIVSAGDVRDALLFTTLAPCALCAKLIINAGIAEVHFATPYREIDGVDLLQRAGRLVVQDLLQPVGDKRVTGDPGQTGG